MEEFIIGTVALGAGFVLGCVFREQAVIEARAALHRVHEFYTSRIVALHNRLEAVEEQIKPKP